ncbi:hypothetical protein PAPYR_4985 [Paratrimastix pyriformis]|uniref:Uncharacterized protein n=1 Tax=Paratrimastix pyriformis TaxID=342808 RepID=A0ABQ8UR31_9EUKA|nr:hypothetical protein PAPYR_4985 [Paratrimastix pyriformis]
MAVFLAPPPFSTPLSCPELEDRIGGLLDGFFSNQGSSFEEIGLCILSSLAADSCVDEAFALLESILTVHDIDIYDYGARLVQLHEKAQCPTSPTTALASVLRHSAFVSSPTMAARSVWKEDARVVAPSDGDVAVLSRSAIMGVIWFYDLQGLLTRVSAMCQVCLPRAIDCDQSASQVTHPASPYVMGCSIVAVATALLARGFRPKRDPNAFFQTCVAVVCELCPATREGAAFDSLRTALLWGTAPEDRPSPVAQALADGFAFLRTPSSPRTTVLGGALRGCVEGRRSLGVDLTRVPADRRRTLERLRGDLTRAMGLICPEGASASVTSTGGVNPAPGQIPTIAVRRVRPRPEPAAASAVEAASPPSPPMRQAPGGTVSCSALTAWLLGDIGGADEDEEDEESEGGEYVGGAGDDEDDEDEGVDEYGGGAERHGGEGETGDDDDEVDGDGDRAEAQAVVFPHEGDAEEEAPPR